VAIDLKYGQVILEFGSIPEDEPVMVFRAQDELTLKLMKVYRYFCELDGSPSHHLDAIDRNAERFKAWQAMNFTRVPNSDEYQARIDSGEQAKI